MPDIEAVEVLTTAKNLIMEHGWGRGVAENRTAGMPNDGMDEWRGPDGSYCLEDGLCGRRNFVWYGGKDAWSRAALYLKDVVGWKGSLFTWNDKQTSASPIFAALDDAILLAKEADV